MNNANKRLWTLKEKITGREEVHDRLIEAVRSHYACLDNIARDIKNLGYNGTAEILKARIPQNKKTRSGELGEILATEIVEEGMGYSVPVRRLRYKDHREMPLRGDDFLGVCCEEGATLKLLKGESKSGVYIDSRIVKKAREALNRDDGRPTPSSLLFVADRLLESIDDELQQLGRLLRVEIATRNVPKSRIEHGLFVMSGNNPLQELSEDLRIANDNNSHMSIHLHIHDHQDFIDNIYSGVLDLGDD